MSTRNLHARQYFVMAAALAALFVSGCSTMEKWGFGGSKSGSAASTQTLSGANAVPPLTTKASGKSTIAVAGDKSVSGSVILEDINATAAHIHQGAKDANGPVILPLTKTSDKQFSVPAGAKLTDTQYDAYKAGDLYINVHSAAHPGGELRVQLK